MLIMYRGGRAGQVIYFFHFYIQWQGNVMAQNFKPRIVQQVNNVLFVARKAIGRANNFMTFV